MRQNRYISDKKADKKAENILVYRTPSKDAMDRMREVYQSRRLNLAVNTVNPIAKGIRIKSKTTSNQKGTYINSRLKTQQTPVYNLKIQIPIKSKTPNTKSPVYFNKRSPNKFDQSIPLTARPPPQLEQLKRKATDPKFNFKLAGTQKYFRKDKEKPNKVENAGLNETLKMVWNMKPKKQNKTQFKMIKQLGKSQTGQIIEAVSNNTGIIAALKTFRKTDLKLQFLIDEIKIHLFCKHPNLLPAYGYHIGRQQVYLVMQVGQCNLYDKLIKYAPFDQMAVAHYISQVASGIAYLHKSGVMHRDIKPENIICFGDCLKIADFGWSIRAAKPRKTLCGTLDYLSPQVSKRQYYNNKIDCWSIGVLMYELLTGQPPFPDQKELNTNFEQIKLPKRLSPLGKELLQKVLQIDPIERFSARQILEHDWIKLNVKKYEQRQRQKFSTLIEEANRLFK